MDDNENKQEYTEMNGDKVERNTNAPSGWTYSANTNQYSTIDGTDNNTRQEYGTQYGYYNNSQNANGQNYNQNDPNYYSQKYGQWDFNRYESADKSKKSSGKGFKIFIIVVAIILGCCLITLAGVSILKNFVNLPNIPEFSDFSFNKKNDDSKQGDNENIGKNEMPKDETKDNSEDNPSSYNSPELKLDSKPKDGNNIVLSAPEVYKTVNPSVVGVIQYQYSQSMDPTGSGSGIILSEDGYIITNAHVVSGAEAVKVVLHDETEYEAQIIGSDAQTDIAVLKIDAKNLSAANLGDSTLVEVGETAYVLGNPGGMTLQSSFTNGIISGLNRTITTSDNIYPITVIQTNAAINPGNSGGALINEYGQVIGVTSSKLVSTKYEGVGFAIPTEIAIPIAQELIEKGYVSGRAILGIKARDIDIITSRYYGVPQGVQIVEIDKGGSFENTKVQVGDIITKIGDTEVTSMEELQQYLSQHKPGEYVEVSVYRYASQRANDSTFNVSVILKENKG